MDQKSLTKIMPPKENAKIHFQSLKKKIVSTLRVHKNVLQKEKQEDQSDSKSSGKSKHDSPKFKLEVSSNSSDDSVSLSPSMKRSIQIRMKDSQKRQQYIAEKKGYLDVVNKKDQDQQMAIKNWKILKNTPKSQNEKNSNQEISNTSQMQGTQKKQQKEEQQIQVNFLKGLKQNTNLKKDDHIEEFYDNSNDRLMIKIETNDFITFTRLEHEALELQRRQNAFAEQQARYFHLTRGDKIFEQDKIKQQEKQELQQKRFNQSWFVGISLAKRFLKKAKKKNTNVIVSKFIRDTKSKLSILKQAGSQCQSVNVSGSSNRGSKSMFEDDKQEQ